MPNGNRLRSPVKQPKRRKLGQALAMKMGAAGRRAGKELRTRNSRLAAEERIARLEDVVGLHQRRTDKALDALQKAQNRVATVRGRVQREQAGLLKAKRALRKANEQL